MSVYKRGAYWYAKFRAPDGTVRRLSTQVAVGPRNSRAKAEEAEQAIRREDAERRAVLASATIVEAVSAAFTNLERDRQRGLKVIAGSTADLRAQCLSTFTRWMHAKGMTSLAAITKGSIEEYLKYRVKLIVSARTELTAVIWLIQQAARLELKGAPPKDLGAAIDLSIIPEVAEKDRALDLEQTRAVLDAARGMPDPFWFRFLALVVDTAMRHEEALGLRWAEVELHPRKREGVIHLPRDRSKTGEARDIPVSPDAYDILVAIQRLPGVPYVFVNRHTGKRLTFVYHGWHKVRQKAGLPKARIHDLRYTNLTILNRSNLPERDRMDLAGHDRVQTHRRYAGKPANPGLMKRAVKHSVLGKLKAGERKAEDGSQQASEAPKAQRRGAAAKGRRVGTRRTPPPT